MSIPSHDHGISFESVIIAKSRVCSGIFLNICCSQLGAQCCRVLLGRRCRCLFSISTSLSALESACGIAKIMSSGGASGSIICRKIMQGAGGPLRTELNAEVGARAGACNPVSGQAVSPLIRDQGIARVGTEDAVNGNGKPFIGQHLLERTHVGALHPRLA